MLLNLKTIHTPATLEEAIALVRQPGTFPLYGGAALQRSARADVQAAVDLRQLGLDFVRDSEDSVRLGAMLTLEQVRAACAERGAEFPKLAAIAALLKEEMPETQRNTFTLGDLLVERNPQSPTLTGLLALGAIVTRLDLDMRFTMGAWLGLQQDAARYLLGRVRLTRGTPHCAVAYEKVARTPADLPIVGAVAYVTPGQGGKFPFVALALCGVAAHPVAQPNVAQVLAETGDIERALENLVLNPPSDHWGSAEYRTEMARVLSRRALARALEQARAGGAS